MKELEDERTFLLWQCTNAIGDEGCKHWNIRKTKAFLPGGTGWMDLQSRCTNPECVVKHGRKRRLFDYNTREFETLREAKIAQEIANGRVLG